MSDGRTGHCRHAAIAPEQIERKPVDARTDLFAFGCVLYELLAGRRAFAAGSSASAMAAVLASEPESVSTLRPDIPAELDRVVRGCLAKDPQERFQTARDVRRALDWAMAARPTALVRNRAAWAFAGVLAIGGAIAAGGWWRAARTVDHPFIRLTADLGPVAVNSPGNLLAISPDGRRLVFPVRGADGKQTLAMRMLDESQSTTLAGTENGRGPFFSPDGQWVGFFARPYLKKVSVRVARRSH